LTFITEKNVPALQSKANHTAKYVILHDKHHVIKPSFDAKRMKLSCHFTICFSVKLITY